MKSATGNRFSIFREGEFKEESCEWQDIEAMCRRAALLAIREFLDEHGSQPTAEMTTTLRLYTRHFEGALQTARQ